MTKVPHLSQVMKTEQMPSTDEDHEMWLKAGTLSQCYFYTFTFTYMCCVDVSDITFSFPQGSLKSCLSSNLSVHV